MYQPTNFASYPFPDPQGTGASAPHEHLTTEPLVNHSIASRSLPASLSRSTQPSLPGLHHHWMSTSQQHLYLSIVFFAIGFSAITALAIAILGWLPLDIAAYLLVWPSLVVWCVLGILYPDYGNLALRGFVIGLLACFFYDSMRFTAMAFGLWGDFIPRIGMWLLHTHTPDWVVGYLWGYINDGGLMSTAFVVGYSLVKPKLDVRLAALAFGIAIWLCLIGTLLLAPHSSEMLFPLTPLTFSLSLLGHIMYGLSIGLLYPIFVPPGALSKLFKLLSTWYTGAVTLEEEENAYLRAENQALREQLRTALAHIEALPHIVAREKTKPANAKRKVALSVKRQR